MRTKKALALGGFSLLLLLLLSLGVWQLQRGFLKADIETRASREQTAYQALGEIPNDFSKLAYRQAALAGQWQPAHQFLLDNRTFQGQAGYEVLTPFQLNSGQWLLVNRGWIAKTALARIHPLTSLAPPSGKLYAPNKGFSLGKAMTAQADWPKVTLYLDIPALSEALGQPLAPMMLVLDSQHANAFVSIWQPIVMTPERHYAYAAQWFSLALALFVLGFAARKHFLEA